MIVTNPTNNPAGNTLKYRLVIFDFDGTLANSYPWFVSVFASIAQKYKLPAAAPADIDRLRSYEINQILKEYKIPFWKMILIGNHLKRMMNQQINQIQMVEGMQAVIQFLAARNIRIAIVTSNAESNVRTVLGPENLKYIEHIESGVSMFGKKQKFQKVMKKLGVAPEFVLSIGDEVRDLKSSRDAKIAFGAVNWGYTSLQTLQKHQPDTAFEHPHHIVQWIAPQPSPEVSGSQK